MNHCLEKIDYIYTKCQKCQKMHNSIPRARSRYQDHAWVCCSWVSWASSAAFSSLDSVSRILWNPSKTPAWLDSLYKLLAMGKLNGEGWVDLRPRVDLSRTMSIGDLLDEIGDCVLSSLEELSNLGLGLEVLGDKLLHEQLSLGICQCRAGHR